MCVSTANLLTTSNQGVLQHVAASCSMLQHVTARYSMLQHDAAFASVLQHVALCCNVLFTTIMCALTTTHNNRATHYNIATLQHCNTPTHRTTLETVSTHCKPVQGSNTPHHTANYFNALQTTPTHCTLQHTATHTTTHYNILKHTATLTIGTCVSMAKLKAPGLNTLMLPSVLRDPCVSTNKSIIVENTFYIYIEHVLYKYRTFFLCSRQYFVTPV